jgi:hypothetical protein
MHVEGQNLLMPYIVLILKRNKYFGYVILGIQLTVPSVVTKIQTVK